jgi:hypothetical protein
MPAFPVPGASGTEQGFVAKIIFLNFQQNRFILHGGFLAKFGGNLKL